MKTYRWCKNMMMVAVAAITMAACTDMPVGVEDEMSPSFSVTSTDWSVIQSYMNSARSYASATESHLEDAETHWYNGQAPSLDSYWANVENEAQAFDGQMYSARLAASNQNASSMLAEMEDAMIEGRQLSDKLEKLGIQLGYGYKGGLIQDWQSYIDTLAAEQFLYDDEFNTVFWSYAQSDALWDDVIDHMQVGDGHLAVDDLGPRYEYPTVQYWLNQGYLAIPEYDLRNNGHNDDTAYEAVVDMQRAAGDFRLAVNYLRLALNRYEDAVASGGGEGGGGCGGGPC